GGGMGNVIELRHLLTRVRGPPSRWAQALRDVMIPMVSRLAPFQHAFVNRLSELGISYRGSPIVDGAGDRYFDESLRGGDGIRSRFLLLCDDEAPAATRQAAPQLAESSSDLVEQRSGPRGAVMLVRPDGYVAFAGHGRDGAAAVDGARGVLERNEFATVPLARRTD